MAILEGQVNRKQLRILHVFKECSCFHGWLRVPRLGESSLADKQDVLDSFSNRNPCYYKVPHRPKIREAIQ